MPSHASRPAAVLLHSSMSSKAQWAKFAAREEGRLRCIAIDLLGYGQAPFPSTEAGFSLEHEADAVAAAIAAHLGAHEPFHLIGHSYGGATALRLARSMPGRVQSLAVFEPVAFHLLRGEREAFGEIVALVDAIGRAGDAHAAARVFIDYWNRPGVFDTLAPVQQTRFAAQVAKVRLDFQALLGEPATLADMAQLDLPTLVLAGSASPQSTRRLAQVLAGAIPGALLLHVAGGHMAPITHAEAVNAHLGAFLRAQHADLAA